MFDPFERVARAHHVCPCCERAFSAEEEDEFVKKVGNFHLVHSCLSNYDFVRFLALRFWKKLLS